MYSFSANLPNWKFLESASRHAQQSLRKDTNKWDFCLFVSVLCTSNTWIRKGLSCAVQLGAIWNTGKPTDHNTSKTEFYSNLLLSKHLALTSHFVFWNLSALAVKFKILNWRDILLYSLCSHCVPNNCSPCWIYDSE